MFVEQGEKKTLTVKIYLFWKSTYFCSSANRPITILSYIKQIPIPIQISEFISNRYQYQYHFILADTDTYYWYRYRYQLYHFSQLSVDPYPRAILVLILYLYFFDIVLRKCWWHPMRIKCNIITFIVWYLGGKRKLWYENMGHQKQDRMFMP